MSKTNEINCKENSLVITINKFSKKTCRNLTTPLTLTKLVNLGSFTKCKYTIKFIQIFSYWPVLEYSMLLQHHYTKINQQLCNTSGQKSNG